MTAETASTGGPSPALRLTKGSDGYACCTVNVSAHRVSAELGLELLLIGVHLPELCAGRL